ncbi:MFS transporter [Inmirania thermothiophila]|uniref:UMF1 family MFS transporter n=1 Tax=Inmirania thermothiophila TaxID=1750597 RepID=A0A3N1Y7A1_9GAMM|nr:MFS transporter [Inmirania thermothiophila]ROR34709.1 UMF1 family MFS transporter [Inmirania thermothiophila]
MGAASPAGRGEILAWACYDLANSGYATVVLTAVYNAYFVSVVAGGDPALAPGAGTLVWTLALAAANGLVLLTAPVIGAVADHRAAKKPLLLATTVGCVAATAALGLAGPGEWRFAAVLLALSAYLFASGENLVAAFLPEIARDDQLGRISAYGWALGYAGGVLILLLALAVIARAQAAGLGPETYVPWILLGVAAVFALAASPTFLFLRERARPAGDGAGLAAAVAAGLGRLAETLRRARHHRDLFRFLVTLTVYHAGIQTVIVLAAVYAQEAMGMGQRELLVLILVVNVTAALGALAFGHLQDRIGSVPTLAATLLLWILALAVAWAAGGRAGMWVAGNLIGLAMGASQSAGRALVAAFTPAGRAAEFFGLWGLAVKLAAVLGPPSYGLVAYLTGGDHRRALLTTAAYFVAGLVLLATVDERRGRAAARAAR